MSANEIKSSKKPHDEPQDRVLHSIDGIEEYDNDLPRWWLYTLYGAIVFAAVYWYAYHSGKFAKLPFAEYEAELDRAAAAEEKNGTAAVVTSESLVASSHDPSMVEQGKAVFGSTCAPCHRDDGGGNVGPNLTDDSWLHGGAPDQIWKTIGDGVPEKGMPAWKPQLGGRRVQAVTAYVLTLRNTNAPGGKAPQGERAQTGTQP